MLWGNKHKLSNCFTTKCSTQCRIEYQNIYENTLGPAARNEWTKDQANQGTYCAVRGAVLG